MAVINNNGGLPRNIISPDMFRTSNGYDYDGTSDRASFHDLNGSQCMIVFYGLLDKFKEQMEEAKLRCADEEDDTSLGEYISLKSVVEQMEKYLDRLPREQYSKSKLDDALKRSSGYQQYQRINQRY